MGATLTKRPTTALPPEITALFAFVENRINETWNLFTNDGERYGLLYGVLKGQQQDWQKPKQCFFRGCGNKSISRSHTIQRGGPLSVIAEDSHVLTPQWTPDGMAIRRVGLKDASTFAGFCPTHEGLFDAFEASGVISSKRDLELQIFRSLCREIAFQKYKLAGILNAKNSILAKLDLETRAEARRLGADLQSYSFTGGALGQIDEEIDIITNALRWLEAAYDDHFPAIGGTGKSALGGEATQINIPLPVALSGLTHFTSKGRSTSTLVGVIPQAAGSLFYMVGRRGSQAAIKRFLKHKALDLCLIEIVESWMIRGTDHWFLTPSVWARIPPDRQALLLREMHGFEGIDVSPSTSIFDGLRTAALSVPTNPKMSSDLLEFVERQKAKLVAGHSLSGEE